MDLRVYCIPRMLDIFEIEFPFSIKDLKQGKRKDKKKPRLHQVEAIDKVSEDLKTLNRGQILMACGTGKTLTSLWIKEKIKLN